jgi:hypothetical protein
MKRIYSAQNLAEAYLVRDLLTHAGVAAHVFNQHAMAAMGETAVGSCYPQVWIAQEHQERHARSVIAEYEAEPVSSSQKNCTACGEQNPGAFEICWNCAAPLAVEA